MKALEAVVIVIILYIIWNQYKGEHMWGQLEIPYTPSFKAPAWSEKSPIASFENANTYGRAQSMLQSMGLVDKANMTLRTNPENFSVAGPNQGVWNNAMQI